MKPANWFNEWKEKKQHIKTPENFSSKEDFNRIVNSFGKPKNIKELNQELLEVGELLDIYYGKKKGYFYFANGHPNFDQIQVRLTQMEVGNLSNPDFFTTRVVPRGMAAISGALEALALDKAGYVIHHKVMYPKTISLFDVQRNGWTKLAGIAGGIEADFTHPEDLDDKLLQAKNEGKKVVAALTESLANPSLDVSDIRKLSSITERYGVPLVVDNTLPTAWLLEPFRLGADIVVQSLTKYYSGNGILSGGAIVYPRDVNKNIDGILTDKGDTMPIEIAHQYSKRVVGLGKRMENACQNAVRLAEELRKCTDIEVNYKELGEFTRNGYSGGVLSFNFKGNRKDAFNRSVSFQEFLKANRGVIKSAVSFGEPKTLILSWGGQTNMKYLKDHNVHYGLIRVGLGSEPKKEFNRVIDYIKTGIEKSL